MVHPPLAPATGTGPGDGSPAGARLLYAAGMITSAVLPGGVRLRPLDSGDASALLDAYVRNREHFRPFDPERPESFWTLDGQRTRLDSLLRQQEEGTLLAYAMQRDDLVVGGASLNTIAFGPLCSANLGYWVDVAEAGRGLASAAVDVLCGIADRDLGLHRVQATTSRANVASQRVLTKNGFEQYGTARDYIYINGEWQDSFLFERILNSRPPTSP
ncbi:ribosomal protein S5-alanine N-acetyltransferase [Catellatospora chokoriensis]|uniref:Ribosomal protein S5 alanine N-acetyltransferase n=2 Tax=Catellatospora chokoriensis TaxID=310353 RepID=A0A8J3NU38_9ACTN|nr:ribosomal protein S5 alanine N-acetyltransferase [Catellatospora chokoriensis]